MTTVWLVNGRATGVDPADRGLAYGDGLFETIAADGGRMPRFDQHFARLAHGCDRLDIPLPDRATVLREIEAHCPSGRAVVKLIVTRGSSQRGYLPPQHPTPNRIVGISPWPVYPADHYTRGIRMATCAIRLGENAHLAGIKHLCRLEQVLARMEVARRGVDEGLLLDSSGFVVGGTSCNLFAVCNGGLVTPALARCGVKGVLRQTVLQTAAEHGIATAERDLPPSALAEAQEIFVTNVLFGIWPVRELDTRVFAPGPTTRRLMERLGYGTRA